MEVTNLEPSRIDMGVDYSGAGPILALGRAKVVIATDKLAGPESCWGRTCVPPPGDMIVYRLLALFVAQSRPLCAVRMG